MHRLAIRITTGFGTILGVAIVILCLPPKKAVDIAVTLLEDFEECVNEVIKGPHA